MCARAHTDTHTRTDTKQNTPRKSAFEGQVGQVHFDHNAPFPGQHSTTSRGIPWAYNFSSGEKKTRGRHCTSPAFLGHSLEAHFCLGEPRGTDRPRPHGGNSNKEGSRAHSNHQMILAMEPSQVTLLREASQWLLPPVKQSQQSLWSGSTISISVWLGSSVNHPSQSWSTDYGPA